MNEKQSLKENTQHGTSGQPVTAIHFTTGAGTFYPDHFFVERHWHYPVEILKITKGTFTVEINLEHIPFMQGISASSTARNCTAWKDWNPSRFMTPLSFTLTFWNSLIPMNSRNSTPSLFFPTLPLSPGSSRRKILCILRSQGSSTGRPLWQRQVRTDGISGSNFRSEEHTSEL